MCLQITRHLNPPEDGVGYQIVEKTGDGKLQPLYVVNNPIHIGIWKKAERNKEAHTMGTYHGFACVVASQRKVIEECV